MPNRVTLGGVFSYYGGSVVSDFDAHMAKSGWIIAQKTGFVISCKRWNVDVLELGRSSLEKRADFWKILEIFSRGSGKPSLEDSRNLVKWIPEIFFGRFQRPCLNDSKKLLWEVTETFSERFQRLSLEDPRDILWRIPETFSTRFQRTFLEDSRHLVWMIKKNSFEDFIDLPWRLLPSLEDDTDLVLKISETLPKPS